MQSRREFGKVLIAGIPAASALAASKIAGVQIGVITYSFRGMPAAAMIPAMTKIGLSEVELMSGDCESLAGAPPGPGRGGRGEPPTPAMVAAQRAREEWRAATKADSFKAARKQFTDAGIDLRILCYNMGVDIADDEIDYAFRMGHALGVKAISSSSTLTVAKRVAPFAEKYKLTWGAHGHDNVKDPEQFATPEVFAKVMALNKFMGVNLDIGHFTAAGFDAVAYIKENHERITNLHLKDRKKSPPGEMTPIQNNNYPWGQGDTPIREVLQLLKKEKWDIPANIEYEYNARATGDSIAEVTRCYEYAKMCLAE